MPFNFAGGAQGALGGAGTGAVIGSVIPGIGTLLGAGLGSLFGGLGGGISQEQKAWEQSPNKYTSQQQSALDALLSQASAGLQNPQSGFDPIQNLARKQFNTQTIPSIAERFSAAGSSGSQKSSAFQNALGSSAADLESQLAALRANYGLQNRSGLLQQFQLGVNPQKESIYFGQQPGFGSQLLQAGGNITGSYLQGGGNFGLGAKDQQKDQLIKSLLSYYDKKGAL